LKCIDFDAVAGNTSTGIETKPKEMLLRDIAREGIRVEPLVFLIDKG
jgi:hypothetical protein